ncbi:hypothetical protein [Spiroplasma culicicola]|uniref:Uncharacterized protein n=1 Tax=Spiroplasma culicicola AES-1 TaxID=1276246 RepID=W6A804_9MOLU|nr:hypothetical protein [Spiroplasma culicicola]AHI53122.1 hypothetical protein SCULI_v1c07810 [Spiroplasma culicicola AES-1]
MTKLLSAINFNNSTPFFAVPTLSLKNKFFNDFLARTNWTNMMFAKKADKKYTMNESIGIYKS